MSQAPSTLGIMITLSLSPISPTTCVRSSRTQGDSSELTRVHSCVSPSSISLPTLIRPARAASLRSTGTASSRLPSRMSTVGAMSGTFATIFSLEKSGKWIIREGRTGISRAGSGASIARGLKKTLGVRMRPRNLPRVLAGLEALLLGDGGRMRAVAGRVTGALVDLGDAVLAAVDDEDVAGMQHGVAVGRADPAAARARDAEHDDALVAQVQLAEGALGQPVLRVDAELGDGEVAGEVQEVGVVADLDVGPALQRGVDRAAEQGAAREEHEGRQAADQDRDARQRDAAVGAEHDRGEDGDDPGVPEHDEPQDDPPAHRVVDDLLGLARREADAEERAARLKARDLAAEAGVDERARAHAGDQQRDGDGEDDGDEGGHGVLMPTKGARNITGDGFRVVVPRRSHGRPAVAEGEPVAPAVSSHRARCGVRAAVELEERLVGRPHEVGLDDDAVEVEKAVDDGLREVEAAQVVGEAAFEEAAGGAAVWPMGGEQRAEAR